MLFSNQQIQRKTFQTCVAIVICSCIYLQDVLWLWVLWCCTNITTIIPGKNILSIFCSRQQQTHHQYSLHSHHHLFACHALIEEEKKCEHLLSDMVNIYQYAICMLGYNLCVPAICIPLCHTWITCNVTGGAALICGVTAVSSKKHNEVVHNDLYINRICPLQWKACCTVSLGYKSVAKT